MKNKKPRILLIMFLVSIMSVSGIVLLPQSVVASEVVTIADWDDVASGLDTGTSGFFDFENTGTVDCFQTSTTYKITSPNSIICDDDGGAGVDINGYWNLTNTYDYINIVNFSVFMALSQANSYLDMKFYDSDDNNVFYIRFNEDDDILWYDDVGWETIYAANDNEWYYVLIEHNFTNNFNIRVLNNTFVEKANVDYASLYVGTYTNFEYIYFDNDNGQLTIQTYFDNFIIDVAPSDEGSGGTSAYIFSCANTLFGRDYTASYTNGFIEQKYNSRITGTIQTVDLYVSEEQYFAYSFGGDYGGLSLHVNGDSQGYFDSIFYSGDDLYIARWTDIDVQLTNDFPLFEFYFSSAVNKVHLIRLLLGDLRYSARNHIIESQYGDGVYCGNGIGTYLDNDARIVLDMCFYFSRNEFVSDTYKNLGYAVETDKTDYYTCDDIQVLWISPEPNSCVLLFKDDVQINSYGFPKCTSSKVGFLSFPAIESGNYSIKLKQGTSIRDTTYFNVTGETCNNKIWTEPNPSKVGASYVLKYRYNNTNDGGIFSSLDQYDNYPKLEGTITANGGALVTGSITCYQPENFRTGYVYYWLTQQINNSYYSLLMHRHEIAILSEVVTLNVFYENKWLPDGSTLNLDTYMSSTSGITIKGSHPFKGNIVIKANNQTLIDVGSSPSFTYENKDFFSSAQEYNITLEITVDNFSRTLAYTSFIMLDVDIVGGDLSGDVGNLILVALPDPVMRAIAGIIILLVITFSPFIISLKAKQKYININVPNLAYVVAFSCGLVIITIFQFIGWEYMFFIAFITISALVALYLSGKRSSTSSSGE